MSEIKWLPEALAGIERLYEFLNSKNPQAAMRAADLILQSADLLHINPAIGRPMADDTGRREWFISFGAGAYVLRYILADENTVVIIRVWHSRESRGDK